MRDLQRAEHDGRAHPRDSASRARNTRALGSPKLSRPRGSCGASTSIRSARCADRSRQWTTLPAGTRAARVECAVHRHRLHPVKNRYGPRTRGAPGRRGRTVLHDVVGVALEPERWSSSAKIRFAISVLTNASNASGFAGLGRSRPGARPWLPRAVRGSSSRGGVWGPGWFVGFAAPANARTVAGAAGRRNPSRLRARLCVEEGVDGDGGEDLVFAASRMAGRILWAMGAKSSRSALRGGARWRRSRSPR